MAPLPYLFNYFSINETIALLLGVVLLTIWLMVFVAFFAIAINISRMRKDMRILQQIASAQHNEVQQREYQQKLKEYEQQQQQYAQQQGQYQQQQPPAY